ncbi:protein sel-1 homolog 3 [Lingula anatina]|uniref:Protein sel-1 homolog 3 n=1 Tax=Lingula anatina TaxID=7574 RepID=A0A2R2MIG6_LINAN|nr:protein sel-1 homolog 3 [Lingula anatina]|eukprot:XP_023930003.1 protein sel-1 homolog 3 [Lingula anatina]
MEEDEWSLTLQRIIFSLLLFIRVSVAQDISSTDVPVQQIRAVNTYSIDFQDLPPLIPMNNLPNTNVTVTYGCKEPSVAGVELSAIITNTGQKLMLFDKTWLCLPLEHIVQSLKINLKVNEKSLKELKMLLSSQQRTTSNSGAAQSSNTFGLTSLTVPAVVRAWIISRELYSLSENHQGAWNMASTRTSYQIKISLPMSMLTEENEQTKNVSRKLCHSWKKVLQDEISKSQPLCVQEEDDVIQILTYPVLMRASAHGVSRTFTPFKNKELRQEQLSSPRFTAVIYLYVMQYNCSTSKFGSLVQQRTWDGQFLTPIILIQEEGKIHVQVHKKNNQSVALVTPLTIPKNKWCRLVLVFDQYYWNLTATCRSKIGTWEKVFFTEYTYTPEQKFRYSDTAGTFDFGGTDAIPSFKGILGHVTWYRRTAVPSSKIPYLPDTDPAFQLGWEIDHHKARCEGHNSRYFLLLLAYMTKLKHIDKKRSCPAVPLVTKPYTSPTCSQYSQPGLLSNHERALLTSMILTGRKSRQYVGLVLYEEALSILELSFSNAPHAVTLLEQASCYGNHAASFTLSAIYTYGVGVNASKYEALYHLGQGVLAGHRLCLLAMGNKHMNGLTHVPYDLELAYTYYKHISDITKDDKESYSHEDVYTEPIRLNDDFEVSETTEEDGDIFLWLKYQASQGDLWAMRRLGLLRYWGSHGVTRNLTEAVMYYRMAAKAGDPIALFDYGLLQLKGLGIKKNISQALQNLNKSAEMNHGDAWNALGWYYLNFEDNLNESARCFEKAYSLGSVSAGHNLGYLHHTGQFPGKGADKYTAYQYYEWAADQGHLDSGVMVATFYHKGFPGLDRNPYQAAIWAQFLGEKSNAVGRLLRRALRAYKDEDRHIALLYYLLAAYTGIEAANFNFAWLAEDHPEYVKKYIAEECIWKHYNLSTQRPVNAVDPVAFNKMGDYFWYGIKEARNTTAAALMYGKAAARDPHGLFNLAAVVAEGVEVPQQVWGELQVPPSIQQDKLALQSELYSRCAEYDSAEAYIPCQLALVKVTLQNTAERVLSFLGF